MIKLTNLISISRIALIILGIIHLIATFVILPMLHDFGKEQFSIFLFMYLAAAFGTILPGLISRLFIQGLKKEIKSTIVIWLNDDYNHLKSIILYFILNIE